MLYGLLLKVGGVAYTSVYRAKHQYSITWLVIQSKVKKLQVCNILYNVLVSVSQKKT